ncbi:MAG TPA: HemK/PrmC family methyltransferase [Candidatus Saccharimonadales bacterium]|nr:HemK/PrmC family methyltransferase [Candidatus Saccharimonadales bacterium]
MRVKAWLKQAERKLFEAGIGTARLDALVLLEDVTGRDRAWLLARPDHKIASADQAVLTNLLNRRARHEPLAYVRKKTEFYGREFIITSAVLEPRPESETMLDRLKKLPKLPAKPQIADVGTGSGALGITAKLELPEAQVELLEIDPAALKVAQKNVDKYTIGISVIRSDLLDKSRQANHVLLCNLPYVPDGYQVNEAALREPKLAIFGGPDGLDVYRRLFDQVKKLPSRPLFILAESLPPQHRALAGLARAAGYRLAQSDDFIQVFQLKAAGSPI